MRWLTLCLLAWLGAAATPAVAQTDYASRLAEGDVMLRDFRFGSGETLPELRIHYATLGTPRRDAAGHIVNAVMVLHGTGGSGTRDANDLIYQLEASRTYDPRPHLGRIRTPMAWVNSGDDFINPPDYGIAEETARQMPSVRYILLRATTETRGHGTHTWARFWRQELIDLLTRTGGSDAGR